MKAITTTYHGPTNTRGARIIASDEDGNRITLGMAYDGHDHDAAARELCEKMGWHGTLVRGAVRRGYVYVWAGTDTLTVPA